MTLGNGIHSKIRIGSSVFFDMYEDFKPHDHDYLILVDEPQMFKTMLYVRGKTDDLMYWRNMSKNTFIDTTLERGFYMEAGKFLVPDFCKAIGMTVDDLKRLGKMFDNIDAPHRYEKLIYDAYINNGDFTLTNEQRLRAYEEYKKYR
jgi:hypothetical protein